MLFFRALGTGGKGFLATWTFSGGGGGAAGVEYFLRLPDVFDLLRERPRPGGSGGATLGIDAARWAGVGGESDPRENDGGRISGPTLPPILL